MGLKSDSEETLLSVVKICKLEVPANRVLEMSGSPHVTIGYLLRMKVKDLES